jgi:hypothetical protein
VLRCVVLALWLAAPAARPAEKPSLPARAAASSLRARVDARLRAQERPPTPGELAALGPGVDAALVEIAADPAVDLLVRARATSALAYASTPAARNFLERVLVDKGAATEAGERLLLRKAALALGWIASTGTPTRLEPLLGHADPEVRIDAALAIGLTRLPGAQEPLRRRLALEKSDRVRRQIDRQLRLLEAALAPGVAPGPPTAAPPRPAPTK